MKKFLIYIVFIVANMCTILFVPSCYAIDLMEALTYTYNNNPELHAAREQLKSKGVGVYKASAEFMPNVVAKLSNGKDYQNAKVVNTPTSSANGKLNSQSIAVRQPIFDSGKSVFGVKAVKSDFFANAANFQNTEQKILFSAIQAYTNILYTKEALDINTRNVQMLTKSLQYAEERFNVGEATRSDVAESQSQLSLAISMQAEAEGNYASAKAQYTAVIGIEPENLAEIQEATDLPATVEDAVKIACANHPLVIGSKLSLESSKNSLVRAELGVMPSAELNASINLQNSPNLAYQRNQKIKEKRVTLDVTVPIYQAGIEYMNMRAGKVEAQQAQYTVQNSIASVTKETISSWNKLIASRASFKSSIDAVEAASIALESMKQEEEVGTRTLLDVLVSEQKLFEKKQALSQYKFGKILNVYALKAALGNLTAEKLRLPVKLFDPVRYYDKAKKQIIGVSDW